MSRLSGFAFVVALVLIMDRAVVAEGVHVITEYSIVTKPPPERAEVRHNTSRMSRSWFGHRLGPGREVTLKVSGPGWFSMMYFQEYQTGQPPPQVRLLVAVDGIGKMFTISPQPLEKLDFWPLVVDKKPAKPTPVNVEVESGEHLVSLRLPSDAPFGGVITGKIVVDFDPPTEDSPKLE